MLDANAAAGMVRQAPLATKRRAPVLQPGYRAGNARKSRALAQLPVYSKNQSDFGVSSGT
jgi:hypothetical protein